jgi:hypothetical protein
MNCLWYAASNWFLWDECEWYVGKSWKEEAYKNVDKTRKRKLNNEKHKRFVRA